MIFFMDFFYESVLKNVLFEFGIPSNVNFFCVLFIL
jgi:hypothetical protein